MTLRWFDIHSPHHRGVGKIEVKDDKIVRTSPAYRWALGLGFEEMYTKWERNGFNMVERMMCNSKSYDVKKKYVPPSDKPPSDHELYERVSP